MSTQRLPRVREILGAAEISGTDLRLVGQLDRKEYAQVNEVLENLGGRWNRKLRAHVFPDASFAQALAAIVDGGDAPGPARTVEGYVATPTDLAVQLVADYMLDLAPGARVLEPSAGDGALVRAVSAMVRGVAVTAVEPNRDRAALIGDHSSVTVVVDTLESYAASEPEPFDAVVMNPPFAVPGKPTLWIDHVHLAWSLLKPGGRLVSIAPAGFVHRTDRRHAAMRDLVSAHGDWDELSPDAFKSSGTSIRAVVLWADRARSDVFPAVAS